MARPDPGILLANGAQTHAVLSVERRLLIRASQDNILALGKVADATRIKGEELVLSNLRKKQREVDIAMNRYSWSSGLVSTCHNPSSRLFDSKICLRLKWFFWLK